VIKAINAARPSCYVEVLTSDYQGKREHIATVADAGPDVFAHNLETVRRLTPRVRDRRADYDQSLEVLAYVKELEPRRITKSSLMLGLGETETEIEEAMMDLRAVDCDVLTLGQYLQPTRKHLDVVDYLTPAQFDALAEKARELGFLYVASGPLVRSSYKAGELFLANELASRNARDLRGMRV